MRGDDYMDANPLNVITENVKQHNMEIQLKNIEQMLKGVNNMELIELEMYQTSDSNLSKKMVSINTRYIVFVEDSEPCTIVHMSNGALLKVVEPCDVIMQMIKGSNSSTYIK